MYPFFILGVTSIFTLPRLSVYVR